jgi:Transposase DDE domain
METSYKSVFLYAMIDDYLQLRKSYIGKTSTCDAFGHPSKLSDSEIIYLYVVACLDYGGNYAKSMSKSYENGDIKSQLDKSQYSRRLRKLEPLIYELFAILVSLINLQNATYSIDTCPIPICHNIRISRCQLVKGEAYRGYCASKKVFYFGFKLHALVANDGTIVAFDFTPASYSDQDTLHLLAFDLPPKSELFADAIYCDYQQEERIKEDLQIQFQPQRKANSKKEDNTYLHNRYVQLNRKHIETDFSQMLNLFPRKVHVINAAGFLLKIVGFIFAHNFNNFTS